MSRQITIPQYNSQTGEGTLSYYARAYGTSVDDIFNANQGNPSVKTRDLIFAGGTLNIPDSQGVQQTTTSLRKETEKQMNQFDKSQKEQQAREAEGSGVFEARPQTQPTGNEFEDQLRAGAEADINRIRNDYGIIVRNVDKSHRDMMEATVRTFESRIDAMVESNDRLLKMQEALGIRQGRSRYAPILQAGILTDEEMKGHQRVMEIEAMMLTAVAELERARNEDNMSAMNNMYSQIDARMKEMNRQIEENFNRAITIEKERRAREKHEFDMMQAELKNKLDLSTRVAPALSQTLQQLGSDEERQAFLRQYSEQSGIPIDILMGDIDGSNYDRMKQDLDLQKRQADIANVENTMMNRDRSTSALVAQRNRANQGGSGSGSSPEEEKITDMTFNILNGATTYSRLMADENLSFKDRQLVKRELTNYGFFDATPPNWYIEDYARARGLHSINKDNYDKMSVESGSLGDEINESWKNYQRENGYIR